MSETKFRPLKRKQPGPLLQSMLDSGLVTLQLDLQYVGKAADGSEVVIGDIYNVEATEKFLRSVPPEAW